MSVFVFCGCMRVLGGILVFVSLWGPLHLQREDSPHFVLVLEHSFRVIPGLDETISTQSHTQKTQFFCFFRKEDRISSVCVYVCTGFLAL